MIDVAVSGVDPRSGAWVADGHSRVPVTVELRDACGKPIKGRVVLRVDAGALHLQRTPASGELDRLTQADNHKLADDEVEAVDGRAQFWLTAPPDPMDVSIRIKAGAQTAEGKLRFEPDLRPLVASGLIEGVIRLSRLSAQSIQAAPTNDGFVQELQNFQRQFNNGQASIAGRTAFFIKGAIQGKYLLTTRYDSENQLAAGTMQDISPDKYYPVFGDSSVKGMDAKSSSRLYVRVDQGHNYLLYGDFATAEGLQVGGTGQGTIQKRLLGAFNRSMTGIRFHRENADGFIDGFVKRDTLRQAVDEFAGTGTSGPYAIGTFNAVLNSEKVDIIVRDRNNPTRILSDTPLQPYVDYTFTPFTGQILLASPLPQLDANLNPVSLRITYEVDSGSNPFYVFGVVGERRLSPHWSVGGSAMKDTDNSPPSGSTGTITTAGSATAVPVEMRQLVSANASYQADKDKQLVVEAAQSSSATSNGDINGNALRFDSQFKGKVDDAWGQGLKYDARVWGGKADTDFINPDSPYTQGHGDLGLRVATQLGATTQLMVNAVDSIDPQLNSHHSAEVVNVNHKLDDRWSLEAGLQHVQQTAGATVSFSSSASSVALAGQGGLFSNTSAGLNPGGAGFFGTGSTINSSTGQSLLNGQVVNTGATTQALDAWTEWVGADYNLSKAWSVGAQLGQTSGSGLVDSNWVALKTQYKFAKGDLFARYEAPTGRATAGGDYKLTEQTQLYGRLETTNGLASTTSLDPSTASQAAVFGVRQTDGKGVENYSEIRDINDGIDPRSLESASGLKNTFDLSPKLKATFSAEHLRILSGGGQGAEALGGGLQWTQDAWRGTTRLEWRQLDSSPGVSPANGQQSWMHELTLARKLDSDWTGLLRNQLLLSTSQSVSGNQIQDNLEVGAAYRPVANDKLDGLFLLQDKILRNGQIAPSERSDTQVASVALNYHPDRVWWASTHLAAKNVDESLAGVPSTYQAWLVSGRLIRDIGQDWDAGVMASVLGSPQGQTRQYAYGAELGYQVQKNVWASLGFNFSGFNDQDLATSDYTQRGVYLRLRVKFDEHGLRAIGLGS